MINDSIKKALGTAAADLIEDGMTVGLGTGSTAFYFIQRLIERCKEGLKIQAAASSQKSFLQAKDGGIPLLDINRITSIDITVDGADEIDPLNEMIKGGGGAAIREKIIASMSREVVIIVDETKLVNQLGKHPLAVEVIPFAPAATEHKLQHIGYTGKWRSRADGSLFITDNGNYIFDIHFDQLRKDPRKDHEMIIGVPGVVGTGFFFDLASKVIIGFLDGQILTRK